MTAATCDTGSGLLRAVLADPASDDSRLIYADWLEENGERDRAEFVRVQVELAKPHRGIEKLIATVGHLVSPSAVANMRQQAKPELVERERELWAGQAGVRICRDGLRDKLEPRLAPLTDPTPPQCVYRRGFVDEIRLPLSAFLEHARDLFSRHPITTVVLTCREPYPDSIFAGASRWWRGSAAELGYREDGGFLPVELWDRLPNPYRLIAVGVYATPAAAHADLSAAAVSLGRHLAGLPPLG